MVLISTYLCVFHRVSTGAAGVVRQEYVRRHERRQSCTRVPSSHYSIHLHKYEEKRGRKEKEEENRGREEKEEEKRGNKGNKEEKRGRETKKIRERGRERSKRKRDTMRIE